MKGIAIVPARGGSKRLKDKNIRSLAGKPLIHHTLEAVAPSFNRIIVATDSERIMEAARQHYCEPELVKLPADTTSDKSTVLDSVCWMLDKGYLIADFIAMFLPTCPLRDQDDVKEGVRLLVDDIDGIISTTDYEFPPTLGLVKDQDGLLHCFDHSLPWLTGNTRSQDHSSVIRPNGALYMKWMSKFKKDRNFYKGRIRGYHMPRSRSADIDTVEDLRTLELLMRSSEV